MGFDSIVDLGRTEMNDRYFAGRRDGLRVYGAGGRLLSARV